MKAWIVREFGGLDAMKWEEVPDPQPAPGQVRIRVRAAGINFAESRIRAGTYSGIALPVILGLECAGEIDAIGEGVEGFRIGERVASRAFGSQAEKVCTDARLVLKLPDNLTFEEAAAIPVGWHTAWHALSTVGNIRSGQRVLVEAVGSSVGSAAVQIAHQAGCWVGGTSSSDEKLEIAKKYGLDAGYNYVTQKFSEQVLADTDGKGADIGLMTIGEQTSDELIGSMGMDGQVIMYGSTGGRKITFDLAIGSRNLSLTGMSISTAPSYFAKTVPSFREKAWPLFATGVFKPIVHSVVPIADLARAHTAIDDHRHFGKIVLRVD